MKEEPHAGPGQGVESGAAPRVPFHCSWLGILLPSKYTGMSTAWFSEGHNVLLHHGHGFCLSLFGRYAAWQQVFALRMVWGSRRRVSYSNKPAGVQTAGRSRGHHTSGQRQRQVSYRITKALHSSMNESLSDLNLCSAKYILKLNETLKKKNLINSTSFQKMLKLTFLSVFVLFCFFFN